MAYAGRFIFLFVILQHVLLHSAAKQPTQCVHMIETDFKTCGSQEAMSARYKHRWINRISNSSDIHEVSKTDSSKDKCIYTAVCRKLFNTARVRRQSFGSHISVEISEMLLRCCGNCTAYYQTDLVSQLRKMNSSALEAFDIIYPTYSLSSLTELHGFYFIPVLNIPSAYYITLQRSHKVIAQNMIYSCLNMWPLVTICLLMSLIAGFIVWILDTWGNKEEFPRSFIAGLAEGFWWSFVTMTTVGYGDKTPKSHLARAFAVLWVLIGITICSIYIAVLATEIMEIQNQENPELNGMKVGALKDRLMDALMIAEHGGILHEIDFNKTAHGVVDMIKRLKANDIDGFLVSRPTYYFYIRRKEREYAKSIRDVDLVKTEKFFRRDKLVAGMLVKDFEVYNYFKKYFESNWPKIQGCYALELNYKEKTSHKDSRNPMESLFLTFFVGSLVILAIIGCFGMLYEVRRRRYYVAREKDNSEEDEQTHGICTTAIRE